MTTLFTAAVRIRGRGAEVMDARWCAWIALCLIMSLTGLGTCKWLPVELEMAHPHGCGEKTFVSAAVNSYTAALCSLAQKEQASCALSGHPVSPW